MTENSITIEKSIYESLIQENQQLKEKLQRSEQLFQLVIDNIPHSVFWKDRNSVYLGCNRNFAEDAGVGEPENIVCKSDYDLPWTEEETQWFREYDKRVMDNGVPELNIIETQVQADGNLFWLNTNKIPFRDSEGNVVGILGTFENITERKHVEESLKRLNETLEARVERRTAQLHESKMRLSRLADNVPGMIYQFQLNSDGTIYFPYVSSGCQDIWEVEAQQVYDDGDLLFRMIHPEDLPKLKQAIATSVQTLQNWEYEWRITTSSGKHKWVKGISKPQLQPDKSILWDGCIVDISQRKQAKDALQKLNEELEARVEQRTAALHQTEARFKKLADNVPGMIYEFCLTPDGTMSFPYVSSGCREIYEVEPQQVYENADLIFAPVHPEDFPKINRSISTSAQTLNNWEDEWQITTTSGKPKWLKGIAKPELQPDDSILWFGCVIDISEIKQAEAKLQEQEQFLRSIYDGMEHNIFVIDVDEDGEFRCVGINSFGLRMIGLSNGEVIGKTLEEIFGVYAAVEIYAKCKKCMETTSVMTYEESLLLQGKETWLLTTMNPIKDNQGKVYRLVGTTLNITERKQAEEELKASQHFIQRITDSSPSIIYIHDIEEQRTIYTNQEAATFLGYSNEQSQASADTLISKIAHPEDFEKIISQQQKLLAADDDREILEFEYRVKHSDGEWHWVYDRQTVFNRQEDGTVKQLLGVATDITKRKLAEIKAQQKAIELEKTIKKLQQTQAQLIHTEKMSGLGQMVAGVAHEINNPANFIHGNLSFVCEYTQDLLELLGLYRQSYPNPAKEVQEKIENIEFDFLQEDLQKILTSMEEGTRRIREIVLSLRNFSRLDEAEFKQVDIHEGIESTLMILQNRLKAKPNFSGIEVIKEYGSLPLIECYPSQLNQVFMNILANAIDALEEEIKNNYNFIAQITICTKRINTNTAQIRISDNGCGIPQNIISKLFDPFFTTKEVGKGTGLGLSVSYQIIVDKHGGKLFCQSVRGEETNFIIEIPVRHIGNRE